jgi:hypothetical protein
VVTLIRHRHLGKVSAEYADQGEQTLKNIAEPIHAYSVVPAQPGARVKPSDASGEAIAAIADKPSIAVLPFNNMSGDPEEEYFSEGMVEDITTELSRSRELFVIARNSSFAYGAASARRRSRQIRQSNGGSRVTTVVRPLICGTNCTTIMASSV